ncbi:hypothetical protein [Chryseolinea sp. H1M3-3]|uniref:hypothetical protein n=1 Tax=Chryseolinea sp. H1M3-3 TaxID=3034144 RepID=UPI0023EC5DE0|nr:hypothetical protein [Chryseolinea sp. H1M3-3]
MKRIIYYLCAWVCFAIAIPIFSTNRDDQRLRFTDVMLFSNAGNAPSANTNYNIYARISDRVNGEMNVTDEPMKPCYKHRL